MKKITEEQILEFFKKNPESALRIKIRDYISIEDAIKDRSKFCNLLRMCPNAPFVKIYKSSRVDKIFIYPIFYC